MLRLAVLLLAAALPACGAQFLPLHRFGPLRPSYHSSYSEPPYDEATYGLDDGYGAPKKQACLDTVTYKSTLTNYVTKTATAVKTIARTKVLTVTAVRKLVETEVKTETETDVKTVTNIATKYDTVTEIETKFGTVTETKQVLSTIKVISTEVETLTATETTVVLRSTTNFATTTVDHTVTKTDKCDTVTVTKSYHDLFLPHNSDDDGYGHFDDGLKHGYEDTHSTLIAPILQSKDPSKHDSGKSGGSSSVSADSTKKQFDHNTDVRLHDEGVYKLGTPVSASANFVSKPSFESESSIFHEEYPETTGFSFKDFDPLNGFPVH